MTGKLKPVLKVETHKLTIIRPLQESIQFRCDHCQAQVEMAPPEKVSKLTRMTVREVYRRIESNRLHFVETDAGEVFICCQQLFL